MSAVLDKIRATTPKKPRLLARARAGSGQLGHFGAEKLSDQLLVHLPRALKAWVDGLDADKVAWNPETQHWEETGQPDHEIRRRCALHIVEFAVGKAIERSMQVSGSYKELSELVEEIKQSPEAQRLIAAGFFNSLLAGSETGKPVTDSGQNKVEGKDQAPAHEGETISPPEQKTG